MLASSGPSRQTAGRALPAHLPAEQAERGVVAQLCVRTAVHGGGNIQRAYPGQIARCRAEKLCNPRAGDPLRRYAQVFEAQRVALPQASCGGDAATQRLAGQVQRQIVGRSGDRSRKLQCAQACHGRVGKPGDPRQAAGFGQLQRQPPVLDGHAVPRIAELTGEGQAAFGDLRPQVGGEGGQGAAAAAFGRKAAELGQGAGNGLLQKPRQAGRIRDLEAELTFGDLRPVRQAADDAGEAGRAADQIADGQGLHGHDAVLDLRLERELVGLLAAVGQVADQDVEIGVKGLQRTARGETAFGRFSGRFSGRFPAGFFGLSDLAVVRAAAAARARQIGVEIDPVDAQPRAEGRLGPAQSQVDAALDRGGVDLQHQAGQLRACRRDVERGGEGSPTQAIVRCRRQLQLQPLGQAAQVVARRLQAADEARCTGLRRQATADREIAAGRQKGECLIEGDGALVQPAAGEYLSDHVALVDQRIDNHFGAQREILRQCEVAGRTLAAALFAVSAPLGRRGDQSVEVQPRNVQGNPSVERRFQRRCRVPRGVNLAKSELKALQSQGVACQRDVACQGEVVGELWRDRASRGQCQGEQRQIRTFGRQSSLEGFRGLVEAPAQADRRFAGLLQGQVQ